MLHRLELNDTSVTDDPKLILEALHDYYRDLCTSDGEQDLKYIEDTEFPQISEKDAEDLERPISQSEISKAIKCLKSDKCPGTDSLPANFYKMFHPKIITLLKDLFDEIVHDQKLHLTARRGIISLLEKAEKNILKISLWRPLSLLTTDYKIYAKVLANRLQPVINSIIHPSQTGFLKGRYLSQNIIKLMNLMQYCTNSKKFAVLLSLDFQKTFDKLEWESLYKILRKFGFRDNFCAMIKILYTDIYSCVSNNGFWTSWFKLGRSNRQGCPISSLLFTLAIELLGLRIRNNIDINGIKIGNHEMLSAQYADDMWLTLEPSSQNINNVIKELDNYSKATGLTINYNKTVATIIGPLRETDAKYYTLKPLFWSDGPIRILGIMIHPDWNVMHRENYEILLNKVQSIIAKWEHRSMTILGKITIINSLIASLFVHKFMSIPSPKMTFFNDFKKLITQFLWDKKPARIRYSKLVQKYDNFGLKLVDLQAKDYAMKAAWAYRWKDLNIERAENQWIVANIPIKDNRIWNCNLTENDVKRLMPGDLDMTSQVLKAWGKMTFEPDMTPSQYVHTPIWANSMIRRANTPIISQSLQQSNIITLDDIYERNTSTFLTLDQIYNKYGEVIEVLTYNSIKAAIPKMWKPIINGFTDHDIQQALSKTETIFQRSSVSKYMYWEYIDQNFVEVDHTRTLWEKDIDLTLDQEMWSGLYQFIMTVTTSPKLRFFQYKLLNKYITTNMLQNKWDPSVSPLCSFCSSEAETKIHMIYYCKKIKILWDSLARWMKYHYKIEITFDAKIVLCNNAATRNKQFVNLLILIMKYYIYSTKCKDEKLNFGNFVKTIHYWYNIEKTIVIQNDKWLKFKKKWNVYIDVN